MFEQQNTPTAALPVLEPEGRPELSGLNWSPYAERLRHAEEHLKAFQLLAENDRGDLIIGMHAHRALEHGMKALLHAHKSPPSRGRPRSELSALLHAHKSPHRQTRNLAELLGNVRYRDPELRDFQLSLPLAVYQDYSWDNRCQRRQQLKLTRFPDYKERTLADVRTIINRAKQVRKLNEEEQNRHA